MIWISLLIVAALVLYVMELILPGITVAAIGSFLCLTGAVVWAFMDFGGTTGSIVLAVAVVLLLILTAIFLRPNTWNRFALKNKVESSIQHTEINQLVAVGTPGITLSRLAPMGKVEIGGETYEGKSVDCYIDPRQEVVVVGYENNNVIVRPL